MMLSNVGITYLLLIIPVLFSFVVLGQGIYKIGRSEPGGQLVTAFGVIFLALIAGAWWFFIR